jgi:hypothetical protein
MPSMPAMSKDLPINLAEARNDMAYIAIDKQFDDVSEICAASDAFGEWTDYHVPEDRSFWHPLIQQFYDYWLSITPSPALPGRQHVVPEQMAAWLPRLWLLDVYRDPLRYRFRLCGSVMVNSVGAEVTGRWLDEVHPASANDPSSRDRFRFVAVAGRPAWRRGTPRWARPPEFRTVESLLVPLAADGCVVDKIMAVSVTFDAKGRMI